MANKSLYVGNLPFSATEDSLKEAFAAYSPVEVRVIEGRGFAFVEIASDQMEAALEGMHGKSIEGRTLTVNEARPREGRSREDRGRDRADDHRNGTGGRW